MHEFLSQLCLALLGIAGNAFLLWFTVRLHRKSNARRKTERLEAGGEATQPQHVHHKHVNGSEHSDSQDIDNSQDSDYPDRSSIRRRIRSRDSSSE